MLELISVKGERILSQINVIKGNASEITDTIQLAEQMLESISEKTACIEKVGSKNRESFLFDEEDPELIE